VGAGARRRADKARGERRKKRIGAGALRAELLTLEATLRDLAREMEALHEERKAALDAAEARVARREQSVQLFQSPEFLSFALENARQALFLPDETCPVSTGGGTRRIQLVREGRGVGGRSPGGRRPALRSAELEHPCASAAGGTRAPTPAWVADVRGRRGAAGQADRLQSRAEGLRLEEELLGQEKRLLHDNVQASCPAPAPAPTPAAKWDVSDFRHFRCFRCFSVFLTFSVFLQCAPRRLARPCPPTPACARPGLPRRPAAR
jgi:hypothetical protein